MTLFWCLAILFWRWGLGYDVSVFKILGKSPILITAAVSQRWKLRSWSFMNENVEFTKYMQINTKCFYARRHTGAVLRTLKTATALAKFLLMLAKMLKWQLRPKEAINSPVITCELCFSNSGFVSERRKLTTTTRAVPRIFTFAHNRFKVRQLSLLPPIICLFVYLYTCWDGKPNLSLHDLQETVRLVQ